MLDPNEHREYMTCAQASRCFPGNPHPSTVFRWATKGLLIEGTKVYLDCHAVGQKLLIDHSQIEQFLDDCRLARRAERQGDDEEPVADGRSFRKRDLSRANGSRRPKRTSAQRRRAIARARKRLESNGL